MTKQTALFISVVAFAASNLGAIILAGLDGGLSGILGVGSMLLALWAGIFLVVWMEN